MISDVEEGNIFSSRFQITRLTGVVIPGRVFEDIWIAIVVSIDFMLNCIIPPAMMIARLLIEVVDIRTPPIGR